MTAGQAVIQCSLWNTGFLGNHCDGGCARLAQAMQNLFTLRVRLCHCLHSCAPNYEQGSGHFDLNRGVPLAVDGQAQGLKLFACQKDWWTIGNSIKLDTDEWMDGEQTPTDGEVECRPKGSQLNVYRHR
jgi:hypothetical protein